MLWIDKTHWKYNSPRGSLPKSFVSIRVYRVCKHPRAHVSIIQIHYKLHLHESLQYLSYLLSKNWSIFINTSHNTLYMLAPQNTREHILILRLLNHVNWLYDFASAYVLQNTNNSHCVDMLLIQSYCIIFVPDKLQAGPEAGIKRWVRALKYILFRLTSGSELCIWSASGTHLLVMCSILCKHIYDRRLPPQLAHHHGAMIAQTVNTQIYAVCGITQTYIQRQYLRQTLCIDFEVIAVVVDMIQHASVR